MTAFALVETHDPLLGLVYQGAYGDTESPIAPNPAGSEWLRSSVPRLEGDSRHAVEIIAGFLATNTVSQNDVPYLRPEPGAYWDVDEEYATCIEPLEDSGMSAGRLRPTEMAFLSVDWAEHPVLTQEGLVAEVDPDDGTARPFLDHNIKSMCGEAVAALAEQLGATVMAFQLELVWRHGTPLLLSDREHLQLGAIGADGLFQPILTMLDHEYLARPSIEAESSI